MACAQNQQVTGWRGRFIAMLPTILGYIAPAFRTLRPEAKAEALQEATANSFVAYARLVERGRENLAFGTRLAKYAIAQIRTGRQVGVKLNVQDILSGYCQCRKKVTVQRLDRYDPEEGCWQEVVVEDYRTPVPDQVAFRIDFRDWLDSFPRRERQIAETLAEGHSTTDVARRFGLSLGRVSQLRREFEQSWLAFQSEEEAESERMTLLTAA